MRRSVAFWGVFLAVKGLALMTLMAVFVENTDVRVSFQILGAVSVLAGVVLVTYDRIVLHVGKANRPADDAYEQGRSVGYELGWRDCSRRHMRAAQIDDRRRVG